MVVTGGGRGIGRAIALAAAEAGARVVVADYGGAVDRNRAGSSEAADAVVAEIVAAGGEAVAAAVDISTMDGGRAAVQAAVDAFGRLDAVACAAGITVTKYLWEISEQEWDDVINVHLKGHFACAKAASEVMIPQRSGSLIFFSSGALNGMPNVTAYATAKAGILGFTWSTANALQRYGITTNCMVPSAATRMSDNIFGNADKLSERFGDNMRSDLAPGTYRDPSNVAPFAVYLMSDTARDINGQVFRVQGYEVGRLGMLRYAPVMTNLGPWDVDTLAARLPAELGPDLQPPPMPWPEPPRADDVTDEEMEIYIAEPDGDARGAVIVLQEAFGVNEHIRDICDRFAAAGYVAAAPHLFHRSGDPELGYDDMMAVVPYIMQLQGRRPRSRHRRHARAVGPDGFRARAGRGGRFLHGWHHLVRGRVRLAARRGGHVLRGRHRARTLRAPTAPRPRAVVAVPVAGMLRRPRRVDPDGRGRRPTRTARRHRARHRDRAVPGREPRLPLRRPQLVPRGVGQGRVGAYARVPRRTPLDRPRGPGSAARPRRRRRRRARSTCP